jgi:hypothetical protein
MENGKSNFVFNIIIGSTYRNLSVWYYIIIEDLEDEFSYKVEFAFFFLILIYHFEWY